jgi:CRP/FNR family transcriptional regulator
VIRLDPVSALAASTVFGRLDRVELGRLAAAMRRRRFAAGRFLWTEGDEGDRLSVVIAGRVKVFRIGVDGAEIVLRVWLPGDSDGEPCLFAPDGRHLTSARVLEPTECRELRRGELEEHPPHRRLRVRR